ncbi:MAG TPA: hypothetical protein VKV22_06230 [Rhodanobacteraceae bacterium]|nr:hypothetical protein [Rhodanobacteraceae bacterium]
MTYWGGGWHPHIESALCLDVRKMFRTRAIWPGCDKSGSWVWTDSNGEQVSAIGYRATLGDASGTLTLDYTQGTGEDRKAITCTIALESLPCHYGGRRWFARCPYTHRRAWKLYKWAAIEWFCCRDAITPKPTYASQRAGGLDRINSQRWALRRKLGDEYSTLFDEPVKPKWMRWRTFQRYLDRDARFEARESGYLFSLLGRLGVPGFGPGK